MNAFDTNAVIRFLTRDDEKQARQVLQILVHAQKNNEQVFIPLPVILETIWVLGSSYQYTRDEIINSLKSLLVMDVLIIESRDRIDALCRLAASSSAELDDLLIGLTARDSGCETTLTFDRRAAKSDLFDLIG
jgi:predicted nucleic-acid-binding protein